MQKWCKKMSVAMNKTKNNSSSLLSDISIQKDLISTPNSTNASYTIPIHNNVNILWLTFLLYFLSSSVFVYQQLCVCWSHRRCSTASNLFQSQVIFYMAKWTMKHIEIYRNLSSMQLETVYECHNMDPALKNNSGALLQDICETSPNWSEQGNLLFNMQTFI